MVSLPRQYYKAADHLLNVTYPLIRDPKLLPAIVLNLTQSIEEALAILVAEENSIQRKLNILRNRKVVNSLDEESIISIISLAEFHKKSSVEFSRGERFISCDTKYNLKVLSTTKMKEFVRQTDIFLTKLEKNNLI